MHINHAILQTCALLCSRKLLIIYIRKKSNVYCLLDASKASDIVYYVRLFNVLLSRVCHVSSMGRALGFRADGPGSFPGPA